VAGTDVEVLITGPTGVGKELYARFVHQQSPRANSAFVPVNCGALPDSLFENELFGHVAGAFTGAQPQTQGLVAAAEAGTLFLDEVDSLTLLAQVKLLRFVQEKEYRRLGEARTRHANVRLISATNADLVSEVKAGRFREDLFFRLRVIPVDVPALSQRPDDIRPLLSQYVAHYAEAYKLPSIEFSAEALKRLRSYSWPGNVRELENCVQYLTCLQFAHPVEPGELPLLAEAEEQSAQPLEAFASAASLQNTKRELINQFERGYLEEALRRSCGNIAEAARASGKARRAFFELMRKHGVRAVNFGPKAQMLPWDSTANGELRLKMGDRT
jgi:DNA-binding NtrC family response regulator